MITKWTTVSFIITEEQKEILIKKAQAAGFKNLNQYSKARMIEDIDSGLEFVSSIDKRIYITSCLAYNYALAVAQQNLDKDQIAKLKQEVINNAKEKGLYPD